MFKFIKKLVSISSLNKYNYSLYFNKSVFIRKNDFAKPIG